MMDPTGTVLRHCKGRLLQPIPTAEGNSADELHPEAGYLPNLVGRSDLPEAAKFQDWIYEEVLPSIRREGRIRPG